MGWPRRRPRRRHAATTTATTTCAAIAIAVATRAADLEEVWRDFNQRLSGMFGGKRPGRGNGFGGGNGGGNRPNCPGLSFQFGGGFGVLAVLVLLVWLASGLYTVDAEPARCGAAPRRIRPHHQPGLRWRLPHPRDHEIVDLTGVRTVEVGYRRFRAQQSAARSR